MISRMVDLVFILFPGINCPKTLNISTTPTCDFTTCVLNLLHIFGTSFPKNTFEGLLLNLRTFMRKYLYGPLRKKRKLIYPFVETFSLM